VENVQSQFLVHFPKVFPKTADNVGESCPNTSSEGSPAFESCRGERVIRVSISGKNMFGQSSGAHRACDISFIKINIHRLEFIWRPGPKIQQPTTWRDVWTSIHQSLKFFCTDFIGLCADIPSAVRRAAQGLFLS
jgi:hypothetical protein